MPPAEISVAGVCERDVDLLLLEEFIASDSFRNWFLCAAGIQAQSFRLVQAARSVTFSNGESDLELTFESDDGNRTRFLIENKIAAGLQPRQAERYQERGESYCRRGLCHQFRTVLIAPARYFGEDRNRKGFDTVLTYEAIRDQIRLADNGRVLYRDYMLTKAIEKAELGWQPIEDGPVTRFWERYWELTCEIAPELGLKKPGSKPSHSSFIYFLPPSLPSHVDLYHKVVYGHVDLQFGGMGLRTAEIQHELGAHLSPEMRIEQASKSAVIRVKVPHIDMTEDLADLEERMTRGIRVAQLLLQWYLDHADDSVLGTPPA